MIYEPREDSFLLSRVVKEHAYGKVLDIGTGTGIQAESALKKASNVVGVDINPSAVSFCKKKYKEIRFIQSDLFSKVKGEFDTIIFNPPYLPNDPRLKDVALDGGKRGYEVTERFLKQAPKFLLFNGKILLLFSSLTKKKVVERIIKENGLFFIELASEKIDFETLYVYEIRHAPQKKVLFAKGKRGLIYTAKIKGKKVAIKVKHPDSEVVGRIRNEGDWIKRLNKKGIGPKLVYKTYDEVCYEFIEGIPIVDYFEKTKKEGVFKVIKSVFDQMYTLDVIKVNKEEMHHPVKHVLITKKGPVMIDFERCRITNSPKNVTQFSQFLTSTKISFLFSKKGIFFDKEIVKKLCINYRKKMSKANFLKIKKEFSKSRITSFQSRVYELCRKIPPGKVSTYQQIAKAMKTKAFRAVGSALNKNPFAPEVPCHRVVNSDGKIGGFASGTKNKIILLKQEGIEVKKGKIVDFKKKLFIPKP